MLFDDDEIRHCCVSRRPERGEVEMLFTRCYEAPERIFTAAMIVRLAATAGVGHRAR